MEENVKRLKERLKNYNVRIVTGGTKSLVSSLTIFSTAKKVPAAYLEGLGLFASHALTSQDHYSPSKYRILRIIILC